MTPLVLAAALLAAPGCPAALRHAAEWTDFELTAEAVRIVDELEAGPPGPVGAIRAEARRAGVAERSSRSAAGARFRAALRRHCALSSQEPLPRATPADRALAARILEEPAFRRARADPEAVRRWLLGLWERFLELLESDRAQRYASVSRVAFLLGAAAAVALGLLALLRRRPERAPSTRALEEVRAPPADAGLDGAEAAAAQGEPGRAIRLAFLAALATLERRGDVPPGRALTNGELVQRLRGAEPSGTAPPASPARVRAFQRLSVLFDRTVYGGQAAGQEEAAAALEAARAVKTERTA